MGLFDFYKKDEKQSEITKVIRDMAKEMLGAQLHAIQKSDVTESLTMKREPQKEDGAISVAVKYNGSAITAPFYAYYITKSLASIAGVSFDDMIGHMQVYDELMPEMSKENHIVKEGES